MSGKSLVCTEKLRIPKPTQFGNKIITSHQRYQMELDNNVRLLSVNYPNEPSLKIKELLEQLDNDIEMVQDLLQQQGHKAQSEKKPKAVNVLKQSKPDEQKKMLMRTIASLYTKLKKEQSEKKTLQQQNQNLKRENEFYKNRSNLLSLQKFSNDFDNNLHIF